MDELSFPDKHQCEAADCTNLSVEGFEIKLNIAGAGGEWQRFCSSTCRALGHASFLVLKKGYSVDSAKVFAENAEKQAQEAQDLMDEQEGFNQN